MDKFKRNAFKKTNECIRAYNSNGNSCDVLGSYTGIYRDSGHSAVGIYPSYDEKLLYEDYDDMKPDQDADDL